MTCPICDGPTDRDEELYPDSLLYSCPKGHFSNLLSRGLLRIVIGSETFESTYNLCEHTLRVGRQTVWAAKAAWIEHQLSVLKGVAA